MSPRIRIRRTARVVKKEATVADIKKAQSLLQSISNLETSMSIFQDKMKEELTELENLMRSTGMTQVVKDKATAAFVRASGKSQNIIDAKKFFDKVSRDDFFTAVTVGVTKAKALLGQKELDRITTTIPAKLGDEVLKVTHSK